MLALHAYLPSDSLDEGRAVLAGHPGVSHVVEVGDAGAALTLVIADVEATAVDSLVRRLVAHGVSGEDIEIVHRDGNRPLGTPRRGDLPAWSGGALAWSELTIASRQYARAVPRYLALMVCAGVIAVFGVLTTNVILVVGAMAISPDLLPMCAACVGIVDRRPRLAVRAIAALATGLIVAGLAAFLTSVALRVGGYAPATGSLSHTGLGVLPTVNVATVTVAFVAGVAGMLSFETHASSAVGVAISITTIPAAAYAGAAIALHDSHGAAGAFAVVVVNITMLILAGTLTLILQRIARRS